MVKYILKRLLWMIPVILGVTIFVFCLMELCPGDAAEIILGTSATEADMEALREKLGLNAPFLVRLGNYIYNVYFHFDFGSSWITSVNIMDSLKEYLPRTLAFAMGTMLISIVVGIPLGVLAAVKQNRWQDRVCMISALVAVSLPNFWLAMILIIVFAITLKWLPAMGAGGLKYYILPALTGGASGIASCARQARSSMLEVIRSDYIIMARSKGVPEWRVIFQHALKNALIPIITVLGQIFGNLLGGAIIIETIFSIPGMGNFIISAVRNRDYPVVQAGTIVIAIMFSLVILIVDLLYAAADPRVKTQYMGTRRKKKAEQVKA